MDSTNYTVMVVDGEDYFVEWFGGRFLTVLMVGNTGSCYFLNKGYLSMDYIRNKFKLGSKDAENLASKLNSLPIFQC